MRILRQSSVPLLALLVCSASAQHTATNRPPRVYDLKHVAWHLAFDEAQGTIQGDATNVLSPLKPGTKQIWFDSIGLKIAGVTVNGKRTPFKTQPERLLVTLPTAAGPKDTLNVRIVYSGRPDAGIYFIPASRAFPAKTSVVYTQGEMIDTRYYIPTYDWPDDKATSESFIRVPSDYAVISNGKLVDVKPLGNMKIVHHRMDIPHVTYLMSMVTGRYYVGQDGAYQGKPVRWNVPVGLEEMGKMAFGGTDRMIDVYSKRTGLKYPYAKFDQSAVPDYMFGGMENISAVTQTITALFPPEAAPVEDSEGLVLHELAHQWFGDFVTCKSWEHAWLNEGWATFLPHFFVLAEHGKQRYDFDRYNTFRDALNAQAAEKRPVVWSDYEEPIDEFSGIIYPGGAARMFALMNKLGEQRFWKATTAYLQEFGGKSLDTPQFFACYTKNTGVDLKGFMKEWMYTAGLPSVTVKREGSVLLIQQEKPYFTLDLPVWILNGDQWVKKSVHTNGAETRLSVGDLASKPVLVDPEVNLPMWINYNYLIGADEYLALMSHAPNVASKMRLLEKIFSVISQEQAVLLYNAESIPEVRLSIIPYIQDEKFLLDLIRDNDARIVNAVADTMQNRDYSPEMGARLRELFESHPNIVVRQTALVALLAKEKDPALAEKAWKMPSYNERFRASALEWMEKNRPDETRQLALSIVAKPENEALRRTAIQMLGRLKDIPGERRVFQALAKVVQERSFGAKTDAINALAAYGDKAAIPFIQPTLRNGLHYLRRTAEAAIATLRNAT